ncbi:UvrD-helicase domain-containing protein [Aestuariimicrobium sp. T2.26MG-19.2B]|uniref:UvrD-helicase domain-containing protein n=1 Tax=Aestuariimicrobium sp. T2.26MG-19.2B TaxID=3040679 RepID=UPI0024777A14|nr:UvrD-helicase domain-containing protein [Aestuariimicrobium sp. T2.26MG-19.2B]CAI9410713.1 RecBCD enzyme subunit RecB [Aestuariimicrobium sp. T2.26MG-19.2B]
MSEVRDFDPLSMAPMMSTTLIEASAGTGKTTTIAALTTRALAEGWYEMPQVMLVTFGRRAASELRTGLHDRLVQTVDGLEARLDGRRPATAGVLHDGVRDLLLAGPPEVLRLRLERLQRARQDFDQATIATTHQFCHAMLAELGVLADFDATAQFVENPADLLEDVLHETYTRRYHAAETTNVPWFSYARRLMDLVRSGEARFDTPSGASTLEKVALGTDLREGIEQRKWQSRSYDFDDMVVRLHRALQAEVDAADRDRLPPTAAAARNALSRRFRLVMIDEYQDTDSLQWQIVRAAFHHHSQVFLIGDPKQAIYAFRQADVYAYLTARAASDQQFTLRTNRRSTSELVSQVDRLFRGRDLGREITCPPATGGSSSVVRGIDGGPVPALQLRLVVPDQGTEFDRDGQQWPIVLRDLTEQVKSVLANAEVREPDLPADQPGRRIRPQDVAIVVRANRRAEQVREHLASAGVPVVFAGADSVFTSPAATDWAALLQALVRPGSATLRRSALTDFFGLEVPDLARVSDAELADIGLDLRRAARSLEQGSVAAMFEELSTRRGVPARLLSRRGGERRLTDLRHLAELLHAQASVIGASQPRANLAVHLARWLDERMHDRAVADEQTRRLEADGGAVQVMTIHRAKGLSLPVVFLPDLTTAARRKPERSHPQVLHETGEPVIAAAPTPAQRERIDADDRDELLRLAYVAATRPQYLLRIWWSADPSTGESAINRLLHQPDAPGVPAPYVTADRQRAEQIHELWSPLIDVQLVGESAPPPLPPVGTALSVLPERARSWTRQLDQEWRRTSYTGLTRHAHGIPVGDLPTEDEPATDEGAGSDKLLDPAVSDLSDAGPSARPDAEPSSDVPATRFPQPLTGLPGGTEFGGLVHLALEQLDWTSDDLPSELARVVAQTHAQHPVPDVGLAELSAGLGLVVRTPLGQLAAGRALVDIPLRDRLTELDFELPMAAHSDRAATLADLAGLFDDRALVPADDPLAEYGRALAESPAAEERLSGWLTGSIDAVLRIPGEGGQSRHLVVDYKTNRIWLPAGRDLRVEDYTTEAMTDAMVVAHYPLQALLYCVALHRFLRWRQPGYDPTIHLGGVGYLFVRGMAGPDAASTPSSPYGVFAWRPSAALVLAADALLTARSEESM